MLNNNLQKHESTLALIKETIQFEKPDLVVFTGDTVNPIFEEQFTNSFERATAFLRSK